MECELCGARATRKAKIEGAILNICDKCEKFGQPISPKKSIKTKLIRLPEELELTVKVDFFSEIKKAREKRNLSREELAKAISEKSSFVKRIEEGWEPPLDVIRKLERFLNTDLIENIPYVKIKKKDETKLTVGDVVRVKT